MDGLGNSQQFSINDLQKNRLDKEKIRQNIYRTIYAKCLARIKYNNNTLQITYCDYRVPSFAYGMPKYDLEHCICHIVYWLRHEGYNVTYMAPDMLFISWDIPQLRTTQVVNSKEKVKFRPAELHTTTHVNWIDKTDDDLDMLLKPKQPKGILKDQTKNKK